MPSRRRQPGNVSARSCSEVGRTSAKLRPNRRGLADRDGRELRPVQLVHALGTVGDAYQVRIVEHDRNVIGRELHVELDVTHAELDRGRERFQRVFRKLGGIAAMGNQFGVGRGRVLCIGRTGPVGFGPAAILLNRHPVRVPEMQRRVTVRRRGMVFALPFLTIASHARPMSAPITAEEVLALLIPEPAAAGAPSAMVTAVIRDEDGALASALRGAEPHMLSRALVTGRGNDGTPILDPHTREIIGYELAPLAVA